MKIETTTNKYLMTPEAIEESQKQDFDYVVKAIKLSHSDANLHAAAELSNEYIEKWGKGNWFKTMKLFLSGTKADSANEIATKLQKMIDHQKEVLDKKEAWSVYQKLKDINQ